MSRPDHPPAGLDAVLTTGELTRRPARPPDHAAEARAVGELARTLAENPRALFQRLVDLALGLCRAESAGVSVLDPDAGAFRWPAVAGAWAEHAGGGLPRDASPCGIAIHRDAPLLFDRPGRYFPDVARISPPSLEVLLVPFHAAGEPIGTVWAHAHTPDRKFDAEDLRVLQSLSRFAAAGCQTINILDAIKACRADLERRVEERTAALQEAEGRFRTLADSASVLMWLNDPDGCAFVNRAYLDFLGLPEQADVRGYDWARFVHPADRDGYVSGYRAAADRRESFAAEFRFRRHDGEYRWMRSVAVPWVAVGGAFLGYTGCTYDVHDARAAEAALLAGKERQEFLLRLSDTLRPLADPVEIQEAASRLLGEYLGVDRAAYGECEPGEQAMTVARDWTRHGTPSVAGRYRIDEFGTFFTTPMRDGRAAVIEDASTDPRVSPETYAATWAPAGVRSAMTYSLVKQGRLVAAIFVHLGVPRRWSDGDAALVSEVGERTWAAVERARADTELRASEQSLARELDAARLLHDVSTRLIGAGDPGALYEQVLDAAVAVMRADFASIQEFHPERGPGGELRLLGYRGFPPEAAAFWEWVRPTSGSTCAAALRTGRRVVVADVRACDFMAGTDDLATYLGAGIRAVQTTPLVSRSGPVLGMISTHWGQPHDPSDRDLCRLDALARQAADLIDRGQVQAGLRAGEERLRLVVESAADYAILTLDPLRRVSSWSPGAKAAFGYSPYEVLGRPADLLFTPEDRAAGAPEQEAWDAQRTGRAADERWHVRKDGSRFYASGVLSPLGPAGAMGYVKVLRDLTDRKMMEDELRDAHDRLEEKVAERTAQLAAAVGALEAEMARRRDLARRLVSAQEDERRRVARDLHDQIGQQLTSLTLGLQAARDGGGSPALLERLQRTTKEVAREVHDLALRLRPTALDDLGLTAALRSGVEEWALGAGAEITIDADGLGAERLPAEAETVLYRVVQEAVHNALKHARARRVSVIVGRRDHHAVAIVEDDGVGFDAEAVIGRPPADRLGLLGMRERVALVGGTLEVESSPGDGTTVFARVPLPVPEEGGGR